MLKYPNSRAVTTSWAMLLCYLRHALATAIVQCSVDRLTIGAIPESFATTFYLYSIIQQSTNHWTSFQLVATLSRCVSPYLHTTMSSPPTSEFYTFPQLPFMLRTSTISSPLTLGAAGLLALADLPAVALRTALTGGASFLDILVLVPGMHKQQHADEINRGEFPTTGAMNSGYVFRVENPATVSYLQSIGQPGHLVTARVSQNPLRVQNTDVPVQNRVLQSTFVAGVPATVMYFLCPISTITVFVVLSVIGDWWGVGALAMFISARLINVVVIKRRNQQGWKGATETGDGDLLILLSQDRWVRLRGSINDLKTVTAGQWLRDLSATENFSVTLATMVIYASAILAFNASTVGSLLIACLLLCSVTLLTLCNSLTQCLKMYDCVVRKEGEPERYNRRLDMAEKLVLESKREDWAVGMGLVHPKSGPHRPVAV
ncbi:uncharacterized protein EV420DRAFT_1028366 [Desarmillaria tabescens]|uniref:ABC transmembrane type-1 domain-containing protein n=1 Tax=Armillaria tabescens TaxID=1929756 RepID=A0AA39JIP8_ARMTA|nr:uncharacterized protein EV420DRAFT_1028366 [Desarmillaria tabescens]KAK0443378.1 hypothetical protein EV420DRAFT_1028366 [Desarmillaria tabescens]